jgi:predicted acyl esterase
MFLLTRPGARPVASALMIATFFALRAHADTRAELPSETPPAFKAHTESFDYVKREEMIPMHDGAKLKTFILIPKGANKAPMLLTRTPYNASKRVLRFNSARLASVVPQMDGTRRAAPARSIFQW